MAISLAWGLKLQLYLFKKYVGKCKAGSYLDYSHSVIERLTGKICTFRLRNPIHFSGLLICLNQ